jgi:hypothetical protein
MLNARRVHFAICLGLRATEILAGLSLAPEKILEGKGI